MYFMNFNFNLGASTCFYFYLSTAEEESTRHHGLETQISTQTSTYLAHSTYQPHYIEAFSSPGISFSRVEKKIITLL